MMIRPVNPIDGFVVSRQEFGRTDPSVRCWRDSVLQAIIPALTWNSHCHLMKSEFVRGISKAFESRFSGTLGRSCSADGSGGRTRRSGLYGRQPREIRLITAPNGQKAGQSLPVFPEKIDETSKIH